MMSVGETMPRRRSSADVIGGPLTHKQEKELSKRLSASRRRSRKHLLEDVKSLEAVNPFQTEEHMSMEEKVEFAFGLVFLVPLRIFGVLILMVAVAGLLTLTVIGQDLRKPLPDSVVSTQRRITEIASRAICFCFGIYHIEVVGKRASPDDCKMVVVAPHSTVMDAVVIGSVVAGNAVAKGELRKTPLFGSVWEATQTLFVDRDDASSRQKVAAAIKARVALKGPWRSQLTLFPEGTCTNRTSLINFRPGAFTPGAPVQPVTLSWTYDKFDPSWTAGSPHRLRIVLRTLSQLRQRVTVTFLPVYQPSKEEKADPQLYTSNVRALMAKKLGVPTSEFSYNDMFLAKIAAKKRLQPAFVLPFSFMGLQDQVAEMGLEIDRKELFKLCETLLKQYAKAKKNGMNSEGRMTEVQFNAIASKSAKEVNLEKVVSWQDDIPEKRPDNTITFHMFLLAHFQGLAAQSE